MKSNLKTKDTRRLDLEAQTPLVFTVADYGNQVIVESAMREADQRDDAW